MEQPRFQSGVRDYVTGERFQLLHCRRCGFAMTDPVPLSLDRYYPPRYRRFNPFAVFVLRRLYLRRVDGWLARLPRRGVALELGAGTGWMLRALREHGWTAIGSERTVPAAATARDAARVPIFVGDLDAIRDAPLLDLVVMLDMFQVAAERSPVPGRQRILFEIRHCLGGNLFQLKVRQFPGDGGTRRILFFRWSVLWCSAEAAARVKNAGYQEDGK